MQGHLFIVDGDLTKIVSDALLLPTDRHFHITQAFRPALSEGELAALAGFSWGEGERVKPLGDGPPGDGPWVWLADVGKNWSHPDLLDAAVAPFLRRIVEDFAREVVEGFERAGRDFTDRPPRLALNVMGSGFGGLSADKGTVYGALVPAAMAAAQAGVDIVLVTYGARPYAAAQRARKAWLAETGRSERDAWPLRRDGPDLWHMASRLADHARHGRLVLFFGAGVSAGADLPLWQALLDTLAEGLGEGDLRIEALHELDLRDQAALLERRYRARSAGEIGLSEALEPLLERGRYSLTHALLASLPVQEAVTTNFDRLYEAAVEARPDTGELAILPYAPVLPGAPWLLKLHGSIDRTDVVFSRDDYLGAARTRGALFGIVQALLMTRHMLFVGYSLGDDDFHQLMHEVRAALGTSADTGHPLGTALTLFDDPLRTELWAPELEIVGIASPHVSTVHASRELEMLLDLVAFKAAGLEEFVLDDTYDAMLSEDERALRDVLAPVMACSAQLQGTVLGQRLLEILEECGGAPFRPGTSGGH